MKTKTREKFFRCSCHGEGMFVSNFEGEEEFYFSYWSCGYRPNGKKSIWQRLEYCWKILMTGEFFIDEIILDKKKAIELTTWITATIESRKEDNAKEK